MEDTRFARLTERQRQCLRLLYAHFEVKEIAVELGISPDRVHQHLKAARQQIGVGRSIEAARLFAGHEGAEPSHRVGAHEMGVVTPRGMPFVDGDRQSESPGVREWQSTFSVDDLRPSWPGPRLPIPTRGRPESDLRWYEIVAWGLGIAVGSAALAGALLSLQNAIL